MRLYLLTLLCFAALPASADYMDESSVMFKSSKKKLTQEEQDLINNYTSDICFKSCEVSVYGFKECKGKRKLDSNISQCMQEDEKICLMTCKDDYLNSVGLKGYLKDKALNN